MQSRMFDFLFILVVYPLASDARIVGAGIIHKVKAGLYRDSPVELIPGATHFLKSTEAATVADLSSSAGVLAYGTSLGRLDLLEPGAVNRMEKAVMDMLTNAEGQGTPMGDSVDQIKKLIETTMMPKVEAAHASSQHELDKLALQMGDCSSVKSTGLKTADAEKQKYESSSTLHKTCRVREAALNTEKSSCDVSVKAKAQVRDLECKAFDNLELEYGSETRNKNVAKKMIGETPKMYIMRMTTTYCGKGDGLTGGSMYSKYETAEAKCDNARTKAKTVEDDCKASKSKFEAKRSACNNIQNQMDGAACERAVLVKDACESYAQCYTGGRTAYNTTAEAVKTGEANRKGEWRALMRMKCLIAAFSDGKVAGPEVDGCKSLVHDTSALDITYPNLPEMETCTVPDRYPATASYKKAEFAPLPSLAKGNPDANECYGVQEINLRPKDGSPATCKCERVTMNGPFGPGALVKCEKCLDVYRSLEKNSCPDGTKIFSPRSRGDWKAFIASASPLRDPNWIIDITRPLNGCGGCSANSMNSDNALQSSWITSDGSPWWLRSTKYEEPNGDYAANCYLDLFNFHSEDAVTFNDGGASPCNSHSKSYFCQAKKISITPKHGSPAGCSCEKVELTGKYSPGHLLKCVGCLDVSKSNDKNSCPEGTKLFSPRSREDWETFIASATPLESPSFIIDVTRQQNGCGGCTNAPMNFETPSQVSWRTEDGSPWWLRSTKFREPNGDYTASCYLGIRKASNADSVTFNDLGCNHHSNAYYCQPTLAS